MNFVQANDKLINLEHVSSINLLKDRMAFDLDSPVELDNGKIISYYAYDNYNDDKSTKEKVLFCNTYVHENFIRHNDTLINKNHISAVKFIDKTLRVVFNFSHSVTSVGFGGESRLTSKFIYADFKEYQDYEYFVTEIKQTLGVR